jgi:ATP-dependent Lhr-like helicase
MRRYTMNEILGMLDAVVAEWFSSKFSRLTEPQEYAIPLIRERKNVLVCAPTGSGKTLTAFLMIINDLFLMAKGGNLKPGVRCVYVSPLKALANDIERNLNEPLREIRDLALKKGMNIPEIRVAVRTGDTPPSERQRQVSNPPHIFITTPDSLC